MFHAHPNFLGGYKMLTIPCSILQQVRAVYRRAGFGKSRRAVAPAITLSGGAAGYRVQIHSRDLALEYFAPDSVPEGNLTIPGEALSACCGRHAVVTFDARSDGRVELRWSDQGVPRRSEYAPPKSSDTSFPDLPEAFVENEVALWTALGDAVECTDGQSSRYALACLNLCGAAGRIETTDGRRALIQTGFRFGWEENVLVSGNSVLGCPEIKPAATIEIGRTDDWVAVRVGRWLIQLRIQKEARFPNVEQVVPNPELRRSKWELSLEDAEFLKTALSRMPCDDAVHRPITLDLNGQVLIRSREQTTSRQLEIHLRTSKLEGKPIVVNTDRRYVEHALRLGFRQVHLFGKNAPALAVDDRRQFLWAVLDQGSAIPRHDHAERIESPPAVQRVPGRTRRVRLHAAA